MMRRKSGKNAAALPVAGMVAWRDKEMNHRTQHRIPVIDLFAGPGGLAKGFAAFRAGFGRTSDSGVAP
jgi:hypothetical protein